MKASGMHRPLALGRAFALLVVVIAVVLALCALRWGRGHPSSSDASIDADVVHVASAVGGRIIDIEARENGWIKKGSVLFRLDPVPYEQLVAQARADLDLARAQLETQRRVVSTQRSNATIAREQATSAQANYELASRTAERLRPLTDKGYVPSQQFDQANVTAYDASTRLKQAKEQQAAALYAVDTLKAGESAVTAREAALALAHRNLDDTVIRATHDGFVAGLTVSTGEFVLPGQSLFTLINSEDWFAVANLRETDLDSIRYGDCATVYSLIDRQVPIAGRVESIGWGVLDQDRINLPRSVPYVERSLNWVRVAQRFPVRVHLENPPPALMRLGASAVVEIKHGSKCR